MIILIQFQVDHFTHYRKIGNFRQITKSKQVELCAYLKFGLNIPMYQPYVKIYQELFPGLIHECPYNVDLNYNYLFLL